MSSYSFKDNLTIDNAKYLKWLDSTGTTRTDILTVDSSNNLRINTATGSLYVNCNNAGSHTFVNANNPSNVIVASNLGVGFSNTANVSSNLTIVKNGIIGVNSSPGQNNGFLALTGAHQNGNDYGGTIQLWGNDAASSGGSVIIACGDTSSGSMYFKAGGSIKQQIFANGTINFSPDGSTAVLSVDNANTMLTNSVKLMDTSNASGIGTGGCMTVMGGASISKDVYVGGIITSSSDIRLKDNIQPLLHGRRNIMNEMDAIRTVKYTYKNDPAKQQHIGFIAQDFEGRFPELLRRPDENGYYTLDYTKVTVLLLECVRELREELRQLKRKLQPA